MSDTERLIVTFEKGTGGPIRTAVGGLVPTYISVLDPDDAEVGDVGRPSHYAIPDVSEPSPRWGLLLSDVTCDGDFDGRASWYQIAFSHIITIRPAGGDI